MPDYEKDLHWGKPGHMGQRKISFWQAIKIIVLPVLLQVVCVLIVSQFDPCNNNPGCMAGNITAYSAIFILPPSLVILAFLSFIEAGSRKVEYRKALKINSVLALLPFVLVFLFLAKGS